MQIHVKCAIEMTVELRVGISGSLFQDRRECREGILLADYQLLVLVRHVASDVSLYVSNKGVKFLIHGEGLTLSMRLAMMHWTSSMSVSSSPENFRAVSNEASSMRWVFCRSELGVCVCVGGGGGGK